MINEYKINIFLNQPKHLFSFQSRSSFIFSQPPKFAIEHPQEIKGEIDKFADIQFKYMKAKYVNPFTDFGFKKIFGEEASKPNLY